MPKYKLTYNDTVHVFDSDAFLLDDKNLTGQARTILNKLAAAKGTYVPKDVLADLLWDNNDDGDKHNINIRISQLRSKFGKDGKIIKCDKYKFGGQAGYKLDCIVEEINPQTLNIFAPYVNSEDNSVDADTEYSVRKKDFQEFVTKHRIDTSSKKCIAIKGDGGIGKTTFAHILYNKLCQNYSSIGWVEYNTSLDDTLLKSIEAKENEKREEKLDRISKYLNNAEKKLLIIDNVRDDPKNNQFPLKEKDSEHFFTFRKLKDNYKNLDVIVTTRFDRIPGYTSFELQELDIATSFELFVYYYDTVEHLEQYDYEQVLLISKIVEKAYNNILLIKAFATTANSRFMGNLSELYQLIISEEFEDASVVEKIRELYTIENLSPEQQRMLWEFAILPNISLSSKDLEVLLNSSSANEDFRYLVETGWISTNGINGYSMHDVIKESITTRSTPIPPKETIPDDYQVYSYCYTHNSGGFAPEYCFSAIRSNDVHVDYRGNRSSLDSLFSDNALKFADIDKRINILTSIITHLKITNSETAYYLVLCGYYAYHKLGNKLLGEHYLRSALEIIDTKHESKSQETFCINGVSYTIEGLYILTSYELSYALSSMGYDRLKESYDLMETTFQDHIKTSVKREMEKSILRRYLPMIELDDFSESYVINLIECVIQRTPEQLLVERFDNICADHLLFRCNLSTISNYEMLAKILDHEAYIITIYNADAYAAAEYYLQTAVTIRKELYRIHSALYLENSYYSGHNDSFQHFFESILKFVYMDSQEIEDIYNNPGEFFYEDEYLRIIYNDRFRRSFRSKRTDYSKYCDIQYDEMIFYFSLSSQYKEGLMHLKESGKEITIKDLSILYFNCYSSGNYIQSLQDLATSEDNLGYLYIQEGDYLSAKPYLLNAFEHRKELETREPQKHLSELSWTCNNLGELFLRRFEEENRNQLLDKAIHYYDMAVNLRDELNKIYNNRYLDNLAWSYMGLWRCYLNKWDYTAAEEYRIKALRIYESLNIHNQYDDDIKVLNRDDPLSSPLNWVGNQSHFKPTIKKKKI